MAVIKQSDRPQFFNQRIGINRFNSNSQQPWEALSNAAENIASIAINRMKEDAIERGEEEALSASLVITDENGAPKTLTPPTNLSRTAQKSYQQVIDQRYANKLNSTLQLKAKEIAQKNPYNSALFSKTFSLYVDGLASTSGKKWGARINDMGINLLAMGKLNIDSARATKIFADTKEGFTNDVDSMINQIAEASNIGEALSDAESIKEQGVPLSVAYFNQLKKYLIEGVNSTLIKKETADKYILEAKTNMALGSINILLNSTTSKIQRDIIQGFILSGDTKGFNLLENNMVDNLIELKEYVDSSKDGNIGSISTRITQARGPLDKKEAYANAQIKKRLDAELLLRKAYNEYGLSRDRSNAEFLMDQAKVYAESRKKTGDAIRANIKKLKEKEEKRVKEIHRQFYLKGGLSQGTFNEVLTIKTTLDSIKKEGNYFDLGMKGNNANYLNLLDKSLTEMQASHEDEIDKFTSLGALTEDERKTAYKDVRTSIAEHVVNLFNDAIEFEATDRDKFAGVLLGRELPENAQQFFASQIVKNIFNNNTKDIKTFINNFSPTKREVLIEKTKAQQQWSTLIELAKNTDPQNLDQTKILNEAAKLFNSNDAGMTYITQPQRNAAAEEILLFQVKRRAAESVANYSSNDVNNLTLLINRQSPLNFDTEDPVNKEIQKVADEIINKNVDITKVATFLSVIRSKKVVNETADKETQKEIRITNAITTGVRDLEFTDADYKKRVDDFVIDVGLDEFIIGVNQNTELNDISQQFGSNIIINSLEAILSGNTDELNQAGPEVINGLMSHYNNNAKIQKPDSPIVNNWEVKGYLNSNQINKLDLMMLIKNQQGNGERSWGEISLMIDESREEANKTIDYGTKDGRRAQDLKVVNAKQILLIATGTKSKALRPKPPIYAQEINLNQAQRNFVRKYQDVALFYMEAGLGAETIVSHMKNIYDKNYNTPSYIVFEDNNINSLQDIIKGTQFKTQYSVQKYLPNKEEAGWWLEKVESQLNTAGMTLTVDNDQYQRVVLRPLERSDTEAQVYNPYILSTNKDYGVGNVLEPAFFNKPINPIQGEPIEAASTELTVFSFPTQSQELYDFREEVKQKLREGFSEEVLEAEAIQKMPLALKLWRALKFSTTVPISGSR